MYVLIGVIALQIAIGRGGQADRGGALAQIASSSYGVLVLWVLVAGFAELTLCRPSESAFGAGGQAGHTWRERLASLAKARSTGSSASARSGWSPGPRPEPPPTATASGSPRPRRLWRTAEAGSWCVIGVAVVVVGLMLTKKSCQQDFLERMGFAGASATTRSVVEKLGLVGGIARGVVVAPAGVFLVIAAARFLPSEAEGIDGTLRAFARTPLGPFLLVVVALGLVAFGLFSRCEARWHRLWGLRSSGAGRSAGRRRLGWTGRRHGRR
jgi:hypothetical protein